MNRRFGLIASALVLLCLLGAVVRFASPFRAFVQPLPEIEEIWEIEDTHALSGTPLLRELVWRDAPLARREDTGAFYCPLGLDAGEGWPELRLYLTQDGVSCCFADDYSWDACADAVRDGTAYRLLVWTRDEYCYQEIVFTGLPTLSVRVADPEIGEADVPAETVISAPEGTLSHHARIHRRGASTMLATQVKRGYRIEFTRTADGRKKRAVEVPGFGREDAVILLPMFHDDTRIRDRLGWEIWNSLAPEGEPFGARRLQYCEFFLNGDYQGIYLMMTPFNVAAELSRAGAPRPLEDSVYRTAALNFSRGRTYFEHPLRMNAGYELYYSPSGADPFAALMPYVSLICEKDDGAFTEAFVREVDMDSLLRLDLFVQAGGMTDNVFNNLYIWADHSAGRLAYRFAPWDLDMTWGLKKEDIGEEYENWMYFPLADRALNLDAGGLRARLRDAWQSMRAGPFAPENVQRLVEQCQRELNESGAMARDAERWQLDTYTADGQEILDFYALRVALVDQAVQEIAETDGPVPFLSSSEYNGRKGGAIVYYGDYWTQEELDELARQAEEENWEGWEP